MISQEFISSGELAAGVALVGLSLYQLIRRRPAVDCQGPATHRLVWWVWMCFGLFHAVVATKRLCRPEGLPDDALGVVALVLLSVTLIGLGLLVNARWSARKAKQ